MPARTSLGLLIAAVAVSAVLGPGAAPAGALTDPVSDPVREPASPQDDPYVLYRVRVVRFRLRADLVRQPATDCASTCPERGSIEVRLKPTTGGGHLFHFRRRPTRGGGAFGFRGSTHTVTDTTLLNGTTCKDDASPGHSEEHFGARLIAHRRVRVGFDAGLLGYFGASSTCHGGPGLDRAGAFPDQTFPLERFSKRRFELRFKTKHRVTWDGYDIILSQDVRLKLKRTGRVID